MRLEPQITIDLETLDTQHSAVILTAAAVEIDPQTGDILREFYVRIDFDQPGRTTSDATKAWWDQQSVEAYAEAFRPHERTPIASAMNQIESWLRESEASIWGNGSDFDNSILNHAFAQYCLQWPYRRNRCLRTLRAIGQDLHPDLRLPEFQGLKHHALHDARNEANQLTLLLRTLRG